MIDREDLKYIKNILELHNDDVDLDNIYNLMTALKEDNPLQFYSILFSLKNNLNIDYLVNVLAAMRSYPDREKDIIDSFSNNQITAKRSLVNSLKSLDILQKDTNVVIWGSWYGSVLVPLLGDVKSIMCVDLDLKSAKIASNALFKEKDNLKYNVSDVFEYKKDYINTNLFINTSCEHMKPMKEWPWFDTGAMEGDAITSTFKTPKLANESYFAFQSNNMFGIEGHINCVNSMEEFKDQLPERAKVLYEEEVEDTRGTRYMLVGKFVPLEFF